MRNLKKILALVLALMMIVSMMVFASAASYGDTDQVNPAYEEAVDVLTGMGVFEGYAGEFHPTDKVTRAEVSAVLYRAMTADVNNVQSGLYKGYGDFSDVGANQWYAGYVGYMANGEWIVGDGQGHYMPESNVTGYQLLKIVLRAIGYGENNEFVGGGWDLRVATLAKELGITDGFQGESLNDPLTREEVAYLVFNALFVQKVKYTPAMNYDPRTDATTIGYDEFGLTSDYGIVVGNQATGEAATKIAWDTDADGVDSVSYAYTDSKSFNTTTGLDLFGHEVKVWYNAKDTGAKTTYALYDEATNAQVVISDDAHLETGNLYKAVVAAGFSSNTTKAFWSTAYGRLTNTTVGDASVDAETHLYQVISNNALGTVDVVIKVDAQVAKITNVDTTVATHTLTLGGSDYGTSGKINLTSITSDSTTDLGAIVIAQKITGTNAVANGGDNRLLPYYDLDAVTETVVGTVAKYDSTTGKVTLSNGSVLEQSPLVGVVKNNCIVAAPSTYENVAYRFTLDNNGKYLGAEKYVDDTFLFGTYADYDTELNSGKITYYLNGVNLAGEKVTIATDITAASDYTGLGVAYKQLGSEAIADTEEYIGFAVGSDGSVNKSLTDLDIYKLTSDPEIKAADAEKNYAVVNSNLYLTDDTTFIVVSGLGNSATVTIYNGIAELLGDADSVTIDSDAYGEVYYTQTPYIYGSTDVKTWAADTVILGADTLSYESSSSVYFCADATSSVVDSKTKAKLYTMYNNGEEVDIWVDASGTAPGAGIFHVLTYADKNTATGEPVYTVTKLTSANYKQYLCMHGSTYQYIGAAGDVASAQIGSTDNNANGSNLYTVTNAKVVDLTGGKTVGGAELDGPINSIEKLNNAVSNKYSVKVAIVYDSSNTVSVIYVTSVT